MKPRLKAAKGKTISISAPNVMGFLRALNPFGGAVWTIKFKCGYCGAKPTVQHDEEDCYHDCPVCGARNILDVTSYYELYEY